VSQPRTHWSRFFADSKAGARFAPHHHLPQTTSVLSAPLAKT
jgi:hypothetical protein